MKALIAKIVLSILAVFGLRADAARDARRTDYIKTREKIDDAEIVGDDPDSARRWLRERSKR